MRTLEQLEKEIEMLRAANRDAWAERNLCTDLARGRVIRQGLVRRMFKLGLLVKERDRLKKLS